MANRSAMLEACDRRLCHGYSKVLTSPLILVVGDIGADLLSDVVARNAEAMRFTQASDLKQALLLCADMPMVVVAAHAPPEHDALALLRALSEAKSDLSPLAVVLANQALARDAQTQALGVRAVLPRATTTVDDLHWAVSDALECAGMRSEARAASAARRDAEERFDTFMSALAGGAWIKDLDGRYVYVNQGFCWVFATSPDALIGRRAQDIMPAEQAARDEARGLQALNSDEPAITIETVRLPRGPERRMLVTTFAIRDAEGRPKLLGGIAVEITLGLWQFIDKSSFGAAMFDSGLRLMAAGEKFWRALDVAEPLAVGGKAHDIACPARIDWDRIQADALAGAAAEPTEVKYDGPDGPRWMRWSAHPWTVHNQKLAGVFMTVEDVTEARRRDLRRRIAEAGYRSFFENAAFGAAEISGDGRISRVNRKLCELSGYGSRDLIGRSPAEFVHPDDLSRYLSSRAAFYGGDEHALTRGIRFLRKDGRACTVRITGTPVRDPSGSVQYTTGIIEDITEQIEAEAALRASEERFRVFFDNGVFGAIEVALDGRIMRVNKALCQMGGWRETDLLGRFTHEFIHPENRDAYLAARTRFICGVADAVNGVWRAVRKDGSFGYFRLQISVMRDESGKPLYSCGVMTDMTEQFKAETALRESEERLRKLSDNLPDSAVYTLTRQPGGFPKLSYISAGVEKISGVTPQEAVADTPGLMKLVPSAYHADYLAKIHISEQTLSDVLVELPITRRDGRQVWLRMHSRPTRRQDGVIWDGVLTDITDRKLAELALARHEALLTAVLDGAKDGVVSVDPSGEIQSANAAAAAMFGCEREEMIGRNIAAYCAKSQTGESKTLPLSDVLDSRPHFSEGLRKNGSTFPMEIRRFKSEIDGAPLYVDFLRDLSERRLVEARIAQLKEQRLSAMGGMAGALAHELNQPLAAITLHVETARRLAQLAPQDRPFSLEETLDSVAAQTLRAGEIIAHLRRFAARGEPDKSVQHMHALLQDICASTPGKGRGRTELRLAAAHDEVFVDKVQIKQVFFNLIRNAFEAMATAADPVLTISTRNEGDKAIFIDFADRGPGVDDEIRARLFEPLATTKAAGMGIGLSLSRAIASIHAGSLNISANSAQGATFTLMLPLRAGR